MNNFIDLTKEHVQKTIMNMFIYDHKYKHPYDSDIAVQLIYRSLKFPTSVQISSLVRLSQGHHFQILLDTNLEDSKIFCQSILDKFPQRHLIVIAEVSVQMKDEPIGLWSDKDLIEPGRYFDKLVDLFLHNQEKSGLYVYEKKK